LNRKLLILTLVTLLTIVSSNAFMSAWGQVESLNFRYKALSMGECIVAYGGVGPGVPYPMEWQGIGNGQAMATGHAEDAAIFPNSIPNLYISENIKANGVASASWTEQDGSKHSLNVVLYSTDTSEALFYPSNDQFALTIPAYSVLPNTIRFKGIYRAGSETKNISGVALFASGMYGPYPWLDSVVVILIDEKFLTMFFLGWTPVDMMTGFGIPLSAAKLFQIEVKVL